MAFGWCGGVCGRCICVDLKNSYTSMSVVGKRTYGTDCGLMGIDDSKKQTLSSCFSTNSIVGKSVYGLTQNSNYLTEILPSFWNTEVSGISTSAGGTGKTTAEMKTASTYTDAGWSTDIWNIQDGSYPTLKWESLIKSE